jgi:cell wall-associated NlpC family hydrolase
MATGADVIRRGRKYLGVPYVSGTPLPCNSSQMDCDCFTKRVFNDLGIKLGWWTNQINFGKPVSLSNRRPGDLLFFSEDGSGYLTHVGIQSYNGYLLHASIYYHKVVESELKYMRGLYAARRLV